MLIRAAFTSLAFWLAAVTSAAQILPPGFYVENVVGEEKFEQPTVLAFAPDGRLFVAGKMGRVFVVENGVKLSTPFIDINEEVLSHHERGLLGMALDPNFAGNGYIYLLYTYDHDGYGDYRRWDSVGRLVRYTQSVTNRNVADLSSRLVLIGTEYSNSIPACYQSHAPADMHFGSDGTLLMGIGDGASYLEVDAGGLYPTCFGDGRLDAANEDIGAFRAQHIGSYAGKILRVDPATGNGLFSNPFYTGDVTDIESKVWAYGLRNPFRFAVRPGGRTDPADANPGTLYIGDVGWNTYEEINVANGGENFGWPCHEGPYPQEGYQAADPAHHDCGTIGSPEVNPSAASPPTTWWHHREADASYPPGVLGRSATGGDFYEGKRYPAQYQGHYFYADFLGEWVKMLVVDEKDHYVDQFDFGHGLGGVVDLQYNPHTGHFYYIDFFTRTVMRLRHTGGDANVAPTSLATAAPNGGRVPLTVHFSARGSSDANGDPLSYCWEFGDGSTSSAIDPEHTYFEKGTFRVRLTVTDIYGVTSVDSVRVTPGGPSAFRLHQNHPNPSRAATRIAFDIPASSGPVPVRLDVVDVRGRVVRTLIDASRGPGGHAVEWNGRDDAGAPVSSGVYFYVLRAGDFTRSRRMVLLR